MKKAYESPRMVVEEFEANEYIAACGDQNRVYKFLCDAPEGDVYYYKTGDGTIDGNYTGTTGATKLGGYGPCGETHEAPVISSSFYDGYVDRNDNGKCDSGEKAIIWVEWGYWFGTKYEADWHATEQLNMNEWVTAKS